jgi:hypothetical protein
MKKLILLIVLWLISLPAYAKIEYTAVIPVDTEAENSVAAKDKAMLEAQRQAFLEVAGKLIKAEDVKKLEKLSDDSIQYFIRSVGVDNEKSGGTKYKADLTVQINEQLLKDYLSENDMIKLEAEELLIIPVFKPSPRSYPLLWEEDNLWLRSRRAKGLVKFGAIQMRTINDQFRYIADLNAETALYMPNSIYEQIIQMNGSDKVYVIYAEPLENDDLKITLKNEFTKAEDSFSVYNDNKSDIFDKAIEKSVMMISNMEREAKNNASENTEHSFSAVYIYQDMKDWLNKSKILSELPMVEGIDTKSFGGGKVNFSVRYTGSLQDLWNALQENGFSHEAAGNYYIIR